MKNTHKVIFILMVAVLSFAAENEPGAPAVKNKKGTDLFKEMADADEPLKKENSTAKPVSGTAAVGTKYATAPNVAEIQRQLQDIIRIHQSLQAQNASRIAEIQRITEQTRAHQQILQSLQTTQQLQRAQQSTAVDNILRQQKILAIQEQTLKNRAALDQLAVSGGEVAAAIKPVVPVSEEEETEEGEKVITEVSDRPFSETAQKTPASSKPSPGSGGEKTKKPFWWFPSEKKK